jgi:hypothetical protein
MLIYYYTQFVSLYSLPLGSNTGFHKPDHKHEHRRCNLVPAVITVINHDSCPETLPAEHGIKRGPQTVLKTGRHARRP